MKKSPLLLALGLVAGTAFAADLGVSAEVGTTGIGVHLSTALAPNLNVRVGGNFLDYKHNVSTSNVQYDAKLRLQTVDVLLDYFPTTSAFRVSGGIVFDNNKLTATGRPGAGTIYTLNGTPYSLGNLTGDVTFRKTAPYLGIGWGNAAGPTKGWSLTSDVGIIFAGSPRSNLTASGCTGPACSMLAADLAVENANLQDKVHNLRYFPVLRIGAAYHF